MSLSHANSAPADRAPVDPERRVSLAWEALAAVDDPELPALSIIDLGLIRGVEPRPDGTLEVALSPTYVGCPATDVIRRDVERALGKCRGRPLHRETGAVAALEQ